MKEEMRRKGRVWIEMDVGKRCLGIRKCLRDFKREGWLGREKRSVPKWALFTARCTTLQHRLPYAPM